MDQNDQMIETCPGGSTLMKCVRKSTCSAGIWSHGRCCHDAAAVFLSGNDRHSASACCRV